MVARQSYLYGWRTVFCSLFLEGGGDSVYTHYSHVEGTFMCESYSCVEGTFMCGSYSHVEGTLTCGSYSHVEGAFMCRSYSHVEGTFTCESYSRVEGTFTLLMCGGDIHVWELLMCGGDIHMWELLMCGRDIHVWELLKCGGDIYVWELLTCVGRATKVKFFTPWYFIYLFSLHFLSSDTVVENSIMLHSCHHLLSCGEWNKFITLSSQSSLTAILLGFKSCDKTKIDYALADRCGHSI